MHGFREEMAKKKLHAIELSFANEKLQLFFGAYDQDQIKKWLDCFNKSKKFGDWLSAIKIMLKKN